MRAFAVLIERFPPGARIMVRLDQFQLKRPHVEERQLRSCFRRLPSVLGLRFVDRIGDGPLRLLNTQKVAERLRRLFDIVDENSNLRNQFGAQNVSHLDASEDRYDDFLQTSDPWSF
jgi:hypothetical protein